MADEPARSVEWETPQRIRSRARPWSKLAAAGRCPPHRETSRHATARGKTPGRIHGVLRIDLAVAADHELDDRVVVLVDDVEVGVVGRNRFGHGIASAGWERRSGNLAHAARFGVDFEDVDLAVVIRARRLGAGHVDEIHGECAAGGEKSGCQQAHRGGQHYWLDLLNFMRIFR